MHVRGSSETLEEWLSKRIKEEPYWFRRMELPRGLIHGVGAIQRSISFLTLVCCEETGMRKDIGHTEGFFSFEAERRGAAEVIGIENYPPMAPQIRDLLGGVGSLCMPVADKCVRPQSRDISYL